MKNSIRMVVQVKDEIHRKLVEYAQSRGRTVEDVVGICIRNLAEDWEDIKACENTSTRPTGK